MSTSYVTRIFGLKPTGKPSIIEQLDDIYTTAFDAHRQAVGLLMEYGLDEPYERFRKESLTSVKSYYDWVRQDDEMTAKLRQLPVKERILRCASHFAYFNIRQYKRISRKLALICEVLQGQWPPLGDTVDEQSTTRFPDPKLLHWVREQYIQRYDEWDGISNTYLGNHMRYIRNQLYDRIRTDSSHTLVANFIRANADRLIDQLLAAYPHSYLERLLTRYLRTLSMRLTRSYSSYQRTGRQSQLLQRFLSSQQLGIDEIRDRAHWDELRGQWRDQLYTQVNDIIPYLDRRHLIRNLITQYETGQIADTYHYLWQVILYNRQLRKIVGRRSGPAGFVDYLSSHLEYDLIRLVQQHGGSKLRKHVDSHLKQLGSDPGTHLPDPQFYANVIHVGIDDGQIYQLHQDDDKVEVMLSMIPYKSMTYKLRKEQRYWTMIADNWQPRRGIISYRNGKIRLHLSFEREDKQLDINPDRILGIDLGLKTMATISLMEQNVEIDRHFIDQQQLVGPKDSWWKHIDHSIYPVINFKRKLTNLHRRTSVLQAKMAQLRKRFGRTYTNKMAYWRARRKFQWCWGKIKRIHREMIRQVSARIVCYATHMQVGQINLEDLSWSKRGSRQQVGYFLTTWYAHWFHAQIQRSITEKAERVGIAVEKISPRYSSQWCSSCGEMGDRQGKRFYCNSCGIELDSDLNAARNIADPIHI